jgi:hypothetical protein
MINISNKDGILNDQQDLYDSYNHFIGSSERKVFFKLYMRMRLYEMVKHLHGDIVECGVFKGSGLLLWLKLMEMSEPNSIKKVIGFDFFGDHFVDSIQNEVDREAMSQVFSRDSSLEKEEVSKAGIQNKILNAGIRQSKFDLVEGDVSQTSRDYIVGRPGFRISLLYLDVDIEEPTYAALNEFWDRVVPGGLVVFDEYAYHIWSESNAVDKFVKERNLKLMNTNIESPTAYIVHP